MRKMATEANCKLRMACIQMLVGQDKRKNLLHAKQKITEARDKFGANLIMLPECFNSPYSTSDFPDYAEPVPDCGSTTTINPSLSPSIAMLADIASKLNVTLVGGSIPEVAESEEGKKQYFNTCTVFNPKGQMVAKHRKMHLFDIDVPGGVRFMESDVLSGGSSFTSFETEFCKIGVGICYDIRFTDMASLMAQDDAVKMLVYPAAFNTTTGPLHWELLQRARAVDNQVFVATASPARNPDSAYQAWGHSTITSPWGKLLATTEHGEDIVVADIDLEEADKIRKAIPVRHQKRTDLYKTPEFASNL